MIIDGTQRWRDQVGSYRPAREVIALGNTAFTPYGTVKSGSWEIAPIAKDSEARAFIAQHHYLGNSYPAARFRYGLYEGPFLVGVAVFSVPANDAVFNCLSCDPRDAVELGRLVLLDRVPANAESWFVARCFELLRREDIAGVVAFSDPEKRTALDGNVVFAGHLGITYQALNGVYLGRSKPQAHRLLPDGSILSPRALAKIKVKDQGWRYSAGILERFGAEPLGEQDPHAWLAEWLPRITRPMRHGGNLKYAWGFTKQVKRALKKQPAKPYPKFKLI